jgi:hypothetical protein
MEFLDISLTIDSSLLLHAIHSDGGIRRKAYSTVVLKIHTKIHEKRKLMCTLEQHFVERKNEGRKPDKNLSLRVPKFIPRNLD